MGLSKLWPNKTLLWKEWKNNWLFAAIFSGYVSLLSSFMLLNAIMRYLDDFSQGIVYAPGEFHHTMYQVTRLLYLEEPGFGMGTVIFTVILAAVLLGQEREHNTFNLMLSMPYSRQEIIKSKFAFGWQQLLIAFGINALIMTLLVLVYPSLGFPFGLLDIWLWAGQCILILGFIFSFTMFISSLSGTTFGNGMLALIFLFFPVGMLVLFQLNFDAWHIAVSFHNMINGLDDILIALTAPIYLIDSGSAISERYQKWAYIMMFIGAVGLYHLTQYAFARNQLESNGEVLMFDCLEGFFKFGVAVCFTLLGGPVLMHVLDLRNGGSVSPLALITYPAVGVTFWLLTGKIISWRKTA